MAGWPDGVPGPNWFMARFLSCSETCSDCLTKGGVGLVKGKGILLFSLC